MHRVRDTLALDLAAAVGFACVTLASAPAEANHETLDLVVSPGITLSLSLGAPRFVWGLGVECSVLVPAASGFWGGVAQAQIFSDGSLRFALAGQGSVLFGGLELGVALRTGTDQRGLSLAAHAVPFLSLGYGYVSYDLNVTLGSPSGVRPLEHFLHVGLKAPLGRYYRTGSLYLTDAPLADPYFTLYQIAVL